MNSSIFSVSRGALRLRLLFPFVVLCFFSARLPGTDETVGAAKPYLLFMGANLSVEWQGKLWPVAGVRRNAFVIEADGKPVVIRDTDLRMKIDSMLKMTTAVADVADLQTARAYTAANDPRGKARAAMMMADMGSDNLDSAARTMNGLQSAYGREQASLAGWDPRSGPAPAPSVSAAAVAGAESSYRQTLAAQGSEISSIGDAMSREQNELSRKLFDALKLSFKVSAARPVENPYLVVVVRFRDKGADPKKTRLMVYGQVLPSIGNKPESVRLFRGGFPRGYELEDCQIHLYDRGAEIGTNATSSQVAMTRDEAFQYTVANYVAQNGGKTLPPAPVKAFWPGDMATRLPAATMDRSLFVKVNKDGRASGFYGDKACTRPISDAGLEAVRPDLCFEPALNKGTPVDGVVAIRLGRAVD